MANKKKIPTDYKAYIIYDPSETGYTIIVPDLPGCMSQIENMGELSSIVKEITELWIETQREDGNEIPPPTLLYHEIMYLADYERKFGNV